MPEFQLECDALGCSGGRYSFGMFDCSKMGSAAVGIAVCSESHA